MKNFIEFVKRNIRRTPYQALAASMVMFVTFLALSTFLLLAVGSQKILRFYESKPQAIAFFKDNTTDDDIKAIENALNQTGRITGFKYVSKDEALQIYRRQNQNNPILVELVTANTLPASLEISTKTLEDLKSIADIVKREPVVEEVVFPEDVVSSLTSATRTIRIVGGALMGFLMVFSTLVIVMIIGFKIRIKRDEIEIMRLLGASNWFIRTPYLLEGITYAVSGAILGWAFSLSTLWYFEPILKNSLGEVAGQLFPLSPIFVIVLLVVELMVAGLVGGFGSLAAVRRYLHL
ncbi:ABC transporter permease [Candidatus Daviesbacteria bacterium]|nr:ABC transporter permease [Candidatus Daviesbacteria bacterium]